MKFTYFKFENFKGIENEILDFSKNPNGNIFALVGLNESGKTTILEAINYFIYKPEKLDALELSNYQVTDIHSLIPINKRDNFKGKIVIEAGIELDESDQVKIKKEFAKNGITISSISEKIKYTQEYYFENSKHMKERNKLLWDYDIRGKKRNGRISKRLNNKDALIANSYIKENMPSILYFPNFLFEFPERIYLNHNTEDKKHKFYQTIIQDILDSLHNDTNIENHIINRIESPDEVDRRNLNSLIGKMQRQLTDVIFKKWNQIFNKEISRTEIVLLYGRDETGTYLEFNIKDDVDTYRIVERSLGFRWFFVYILLTQFRTYRKRNQNALFLFDEPASNLHPSAQVELLKSFEKLPSVVYTTHSHYLINPKWLENTFVIKNEAIDYENEEFSISKNTNITIHRYREFVVKYPNQHSYFQPILEVLDYKPSKLELVPKAVIVEGKNDYYTINYFQEIIFKNSVQINIIPGSSASNFEILISLYLGWGSKFIILLDSDKEGIKQRKRYVDLFGLSISELIFTLKDINNLWTNSSIESLFSVADKENIVKWIYGENSSLNKVILNRSIQELYYKNESFNFSDDTMSNFKLLVGKLGDELSKC